MAEKKNNAKITPLELYQQAGIDPKTKLPIKIAAATSNPCSKNDILKAIRILDEQNAVNRGRWYNLPSGISSQELERLLYYRGQLCFFYYKKLDKFYFMPYALDGSIDFYKRFNTIHPIPFADGADDEKSKRYKDQLAILSSLKLNCVYDVITDEDEVTEDLLFNSAVLIHDYTKQLSETIIPRKDIQEPILKVMSEVIPLMRTSLMSGSGTKALRVNDADQADSVKEASEQFKTAALNGDQYIPVVGTIDFQDLQNSGFTKPQDYMLALQSLDNFRLSLYGIENGGLFEKKAHELEKEAAINGGPVGLVMQDYVSIRQRFCNIVNSIWGLGIWYEPSENIAETDINGDGVMYDRDEDTGGTEYESNDTEV